MADNETLIEGPLYASRKKVYPAAVHGRFRNIKWALLIFALGVYYFLPFVRWDRGPNLPNQAVLLDLPHRRFYFFFIELWPQEIYYFTGLLVIAAMALFLMNAVAGRVWCGYLCPQTIWTDLFYAVERWVEGDRRDRMRKDKGPTTFQHVREVGTKYFLWLMIAWWTGGAWVLYFADAPTLVKELATLHAPFTAYLWIGILTVTTFLFAGLAREQVCIYMCPWPRIQAALTDEWALNVTYRGDRGEPRTSAKKAAQLRAQGEAAGDCVDCNQCVAVCPTGVDIRDGSQLGCIQCGLCIDACDHIMTQIGRPTGLVAYDNGLNQERREAGKPEVYRFIRARTLLYAGIIGVVGLIMMYALATRQEIAFSVWHQRNPVFVMLSDGRIRNDYDVRLQNRKPDARSFVVSIEGLPGAVVQAIGQLDETNGKPVFAIGPDQTREVRVSVTVPASMAKDEPHTITFRLNDAATKETASVVEHFISK